MSWDLVDHCCRHCLGRVIRQGPQYRCASCGANTMARVSDICGCGIKPTRAKPSVGGFHCSRNPKPGGQFPQEIIVFFGTEPALPVLLE